MYLFIFFILESIGTQELVLIGLVALIVFGPRKLPQMARKFGNMLAEFRKVSNDFKQTWEREATMVESAFRPDVSTPTAITEKATVVAEEGVPQEIKTVPQTELLPEVREMSKEDFENARADRIEDSAASLDPDPEPDEIESSPLDKRNWL